MERHTIIGVLPPGIYYPASRPGPHLHTAGSATRRNKPRIPGFLTAPIGEGEADGIPGAERVLSWKRSRLAWLNNIPCEQRCDL